MNTPENIITLKDNEIFVFGSNLLGLHIGGAALVAKEKFGAINGKSFGLQGKSYAIPTLDNSFKRLPLSVVRLYLDDFAQEAIANPKITYYLTKIGCGIAGFKIEEIKYILPKFPKNVILPFEFTK